VIRSRRCSGCVQRIAPRMAARELLCRCFMKRATYSIPIGIAVIVVAGMVATGCDDGGGLGSGKTDAGASDAVASLGGQSGSTSSAGGTAGTLGTGGAMGTGGAAGSVGTGGAVDAGGLAGAKGTGGMTGSGGTTGSGGSKGGSDGGVDAAVDVSTSDGGGRVDGAADAGAKDASASETPALPDAPVVCGPICDIYCAYGNVLDVNGCPTCTCNPPPCPSMPCPSCAYGYVRDSNGCWTCTCAPVASCGQLLDAGLCEASSHCRWLTPGCAMGGNPLAQSESGCYEQVDCLTTSDCTETGSTCVDRTVAPPGGPGGDWCGMAVRICL
jgi:hypothetical protein